MLRLPAVAGRFYPDNPQELIAQVREYSEPQPNGNPRHVQACLVPHAGYRFSGHVAGAVFARIVLPKKIRKNRAWCANSMLELKKKATPLSSTFDGATRCCVFAATESRAVNA